MRQPGTARALVQRSGVSVRDWARALVCTRSAMHKLLSANPGLKQGRLMQRLQALLDDLRDERVWWERDRTTHAHGSPRRVLVRERKPEPPVWEPRFAVRVDPFKLQLSFVPIEDAPAKPGANEQAESPAVESWKPWGLTNDDSEDEARGKLRRTRFQGSTLDPPGSTFPRRPMRRG